MVRAIRGATVAPSNTTQAILAATRELLEEIARANRLSQSHLISAIFTMTPDLNAAFPTQAARELGWDDVPMLCAQEIDVPEAMKQVVRVLVHVESDRPPHHVYLGQAGQLRPDWVQGNPMRCQRSGPMT